MVNLAHSGKLMSNTSVMFQLHTSVLNRQWEKSLEVSALSVHE